MMQFSVDTAEKDAARAPLPAALLREEAERGDRVETIGVYVHIPWCRAICTYCDFDRQSHGFELIPKYVQAILADIRRQPRRLAHSVFFGGGTPSLIDPSEVGAVLRAIRTHFGLTPKAEISLEANPGDIDRLRVAAFLEAGVNRLSIGVQSFDDATLRLLGRRHTAAGATDAVREARLGGATNLSLDLMYGLPGQSPAQWRRTLERAVDLGPDHISAYLLTIDDRVPLGRQVSRCTLTLPPDEELAEMYGDAQSRLDEASFEQYEISNWARPGHQSRHNLTYWRDEPYLGIGAGAASSYRGRRFKNTPDPAAYIAAVASEMPDLVEDEQPDALTAVQDHLALRLRIGDGLDLDLVQRRFGQDLRTRLGPDLETLTRAGLLELHGGSLRIEPSRYLVSNEIILRLHDALARAWPSRQHWDAAREP